MFEFVVRFFSTFEIRSNDCSGQNFDKVKFSGQKASTKMIYDDYGENVVKGKILFELELKLDTFISISQRKAIKVFDYLGVVGGFAAAFEGVLSVIGAYFSTRFLSSSIAQNLYIKKKPSNEIKSLMSKKFKRSKV